LIHRKYWAIQAKYRAERSRSLTFRELSTFAALAYASCRNVDYALICTTTERVSRELEGRPRRIGFRTSEVWQGLGKDFFRQVHALLAYRQVRRVNYFCCSPRQGP
jgi:hypothetical protein